MHLFQFVLCATVVVLLQTNSSYADCRFGNTTVPVCYWTPWSNFPCDDCCSGQSNVVKRTRGLCCPGGLSNCWHVCGVSDTHSSKEETSDCSVCTCPGTTRSDLIYYEDADDVANCGGQCSSDGNWGQCVRDCSVLKAAMLCTILETGLFFLGLAIGISLTALVACLSWRKKRQNWEKQARSAASNGQPL